MSMKELMIIIKSYGAQLNSLLTWGRGGGERGGGVSTMRRRRRRRKRRRRRGEHNVLCGRVLLTDDHCSTLFDRSGNPVTAHIVRGQ